MYIFCCPGLASCRRRPLSSNVRRHTTDMLSLALKKKRPMPPSARPGKTLVLDVGQSIIGIYCVQHRRYDAYQDVRRIHGLRRIARAGELITYNGDRYDLTEISLLSERLGYAAFKLPPRHVDMRTVCWGPHIIGSSLENTYERQFGSIPSPSTSYEEDCRRDVRMTFELWSAWCRRALKVNYGAER